MFPKYVLSAAALLTVLASDAYARPAGMQAPQAPRPAQPAPPSDPAKPVGPPRGKPPYPGLPISVGAPSSGASTPTPSKEEDARTDAPSFIETAGHDGRVEIDLAKLAESQATRPDVKAFAKMLAADHQKANDELAVMAKTKNVTIPSDPTPADRDTKAGLEGATGAAFDTLYLRTMVEDHTKAVAAFTMAAKSSDDADVKAFAEKTLPTLKHHLEEAQKLAKTGK